jgi:hypothetical protein
VSTLLRITHIFGWALNAQESPLPTPYDIVGFPAFAWEPTSLLWALAGTVFVGSVAYHLLSKPKERAKSDQGMWRSCKVELERVLESGGGCEDARDRAAAASRSVRRLLEVHLQRPITSLSSQEISNFQIDESISPVTRQILSIVQKLDDWRFAPSVDPERVQHEIRALVSVIHSYKGD